MEYEICSGKAYLPGTELFIPCILLMTNCNSQKCCNRICDIGITRGVSYEAWDSTLNFIKTKYLSAEKCRQNLFLEVDYTINHCDNYTYFGMNFNEDGMHDSGILDRINL
jgi:hypothetical protein